MKTLCLMSAALFLLCGCGGADAATQARSAAQVCDEICDWPDECFIQLGVPVQGADCAADCQTQAGLVGLACLTAISDTVACLGTCDFQSLSEEELLACQNVAFEIQTACE